MSGHSKWAGIKHRKGAQDAKRGKIFTKLIREITVAAREGGGNPDINARLRSAIIRAREANMPGDNVDKAVKKGTGELPGVTYESCMFEGYGPGGVAVIAEALTDNKNRATAEIRNVFSKRGGNLAGTGSVAWQFVQKGYILINKEAISEEELFNIAIEAGAEDVKTDGSNFEVTSETKNFESVKQALQAKDIKWEVAELTMIPNTTVKVQGQQAKQILALVESLEEQDDVQKVHANFDIPDEIMEEMANEE
ncbi:YebC/PmpR family DNA-binding transcriptional regulator [Candidatus Omnitrophota bacterium]